MIQTELLKHIIEKANVIKQEFGSEVLSASHVVAAVADLCKTKYTGFALPDCTYPRFEEERLRYIFSKEIKLAAYFRLRLSINIKEGVSEDQFKIESCEEIALLKNRDILSADLVFLCALKQLHNSYKGALRSISDNKSIFLILEDTDKNIYDYVIEKIDDIRCELKKKSDEARAIRDWKPAAKFAEPQELIKKFFDKVYTSCENDVLHITIPGFLRETDLKLSIYKVKGSYIVNDNGCAVKCLSKRIDNIKLKKVLELIWGKSNLQDNKLFTTFTDVKSVLYFIQEVILTANADLYYEYFRQDAFGDRYYIEPCLSLANEQLAQEFNANAFLDALIETLTAYYDENKGLLLRFDTKYCNCSYGIKVLIETLSDGTLRLSDAYKNKQYETGEMLEAFYSSSREEYDDMYYEVMQKLAKPFGMEFDMTSSIIFPEYSGNSHNHKNPYMLSTVGTWLQDFYKFINSAVLISVVADRINYEKLREW